MKSNGSLLDTFCRSAALGLLMAASGTVLWAQQSNVGQEAQRTPVLLASSSPALDLASPGSSSSSSSSADSNGEFLFSAAARDAAQPPPRRYGRPRYSGGNTNADGSSKFAFMAGAGASVPVGNTAKYETPSYDFQVGVGRNWNKSVGVIFQFDYDHFGLQGKTLANQQYLYNVLYPCSPVDQRAGRCSPYTNLDGSNHVWSFTLNPTFTLATEGSLGAYAVVGGGYYHKVTNFTLPYNGVSCDYTGYYCYQYQANQVIDHYTSNAAGINGGIGLTYKFSQFSNERFYMEARYVVLFNKQRYGLTAGNVFTAPAYSDNQYPANSNRTTYIPITVGVRF